MAETIYIATDHTATFGPLKDQDGNVVEGATVTAVLLSNKSQVLDPQLSPFPMTFEDAGEGMYTAPIPNDHELQVNVGYLGRFTAVAGNGIQREWDSQFTVKRGTI